MPSEREMERARRNAPAVADLVQWRIVTDKLKAGKSLFPDEARLFLSKKGDLDYRDIDAFILARKETRAEFFARMESLSTPEHNPL